MSDTIIASLITCFATIVAALIGGYFLIRKRRRDLGNGSIEDTAIKFLDPNENFNELLNNARVILMYTVNSYELYNKVNVILEQNPSIVLNKLIILVRKKDKETKDDLDILNRMISLWRKWVDKRRIKNLIIIGYDHDPDHYYTVFGDQMAFSGQVLFDDTKPTGTTVDYLPLVFRDDNSVGRQVIQNYQQHFYNVIDRYQDKLTLYTSAEDI